MDWLILILVIFLYGFFEKLNSIYDRSSKNKYKNNLSPLDEIPHNDKKNKLSFTKILKALKIHLSGATGSFEKIVELSNAAAQKDSDKVKLLNWQLQNEAKHRDREISALISPNEKEKSDYDYSLDWKKISENNEIMAKDNELKKKGDNYELAIGILLERRRYIVIYNGLIRGCKDLGVDIIAISEERKEVLMIQCKNWENFKMTTDRLEKIYRKFLNFFTIDYFDIHPSVIIQSSQILKKNENYIARIVEKSKNYSTSMLLCMNSDDVLTDDVLQILSNSSTTNFHGISCDMYKYRSILSLLILPFNLLYENHINELKMLDEFGL